AATAAAAAAEGARVLLASVGPAHQAAALAGAAAAPEPQTIAPNLDLWCLDPLADLSAVWGALRSPGGPPVVGDELPIIPGSDLFLAATRLRKLEGGYDLACVDAGPPEALLRSLGAPDTFRWLVRLLIGLDRGPGRSSASVARAIIPTSLLPMAGDWLGRIQDARVQLEALRDQMTAPEGVQVRYVMGADRGSLAEARVAVPALQLFGLAVECLVAGPTLPAGLAGLEVLAAEQAAAIDEAGAVFHGRAVYSLDAGATPGGAEALAAIGARMYGEDSPLPGPPPTAPVALSGPPEPAVALNLPGLPREQLGLTLSGDELIVRAGPYRRHLLLPEGLRGTTAIKAARQGETLVIRPRG
ncbi:MAG TPA: ArsA-related P-loop ATPase, partial [Chloroflexaceae bacterium]|nr:ArsA-related P-loop ATPase [Chloroflexaceae bacterium]